MCGRQFQSKRNEFSFEWTRPIRDQGRLCVYTGGLATSTSAHIQTKWEIARHVQRLVPNDWKKFAPVGLEIQITSRTSAEGCFDVVPLIVRALKGVAFEHERQIESLSVTRKLSTNYVVLVRVYESREEPTGVCK